MNSKDLIGRTALFMAARLNLRSEVKALLAAKANPLIRTTAGKTPYQVCNSKKIKSFILKASLLSICIPMIPTQNQRDWVWESEGLHYFNSNAEQIDEFTKFS